MVGRLMPRAFSCPQFLLPPTVISGAGIQTNCGELLRLPTRGTFLPALARWHDRVGPGKGLWIPVATGMTGEGVAIETGDN